MQRLPSRDDRVEWRPLAQFLNISHRGASAYAPENTTAAWDLATCLGAHFIELDVHMTLDHQLVALHDPTLERTARRGLDQAEGAIASHTLDELKCYDFGRWFNENNSTHRRQEYEGLKVLALEEVLARYRHLIRFCIELKAPDGTPGVEDELLRLLRRFSLLEPKHGSWRVLVMSFSPRSLKRLNAQGHGLPLTQLFKEHHTSESIEVQLDLVRRYARGIGVYHPTPDPELVHAAHRRNLDVYTYTVNDTNEMRRLLDLRVDGMITDFPDRLDRLVWEESTRARARVTT